MKKIIHITSSNRTSEILDYIHDLWIDLDRIEYIEPEHELTIPILIKAKQRKGSIISKNNKHYKEKYLLVINNVNNRRIEDTEKVGYYDINAIVYNDETNILTIKTGIPLAFEMIVSEFELFLFG